MYDLDVTTSVLLVLVAAAVAFAVAAIRDDRAFVRIEAQLPEFRAILARRGMSLSKAHRVNRARCETVWVLRHRDGSEYQMMSATTLSHLRWFEDIDKRFRDERGLL